MVAYQNSTTNETQSQQSPEIKKLAREYVKGMLEGKHDPERQYDIFGEYEEAIVDVERYGNRCHWDIGRITFKINSLPLLQNLLKESPLQGGKRFRFMEDDEIENMPVREWLIAGILPKEGVAMLFGESQTYKSFIAIGWALSIGYGYGWMGKEVSQGNVAYIAAEGAFGLGPRVKAWKSYHKKTGKSGVRWLGEFVPLSDKTSIADLMEALDETYSEENPLKLLIIDTLSRNSGGADEDNNSQMAKVIQSVDIIQQKYKCTVLIIHHDGKDKSKGPRGASALVGNMETIINTSFVNDVIKMECYKQKDAAKFEPIFLTLQGVQYGNTDETSVVLVETNAPVKKEDNKVSLKNNTQKMYDVLLGKELTSTLWVNLGIASGMSESSAKKAQKELKDNGRVRQKGEGKGALYYIPMQGGRAMFDTTEDEKEND